jgi:uncharacterized RDD family membrane protein YckC
MTQSPAGWYPDPAQTHPARQRYWDGAQWTEHVHDPLPASMPPAYGQPVFAGPRTTPDGQPLSGWWRRVAAQVLDGLFLIPVYAVVVVPVILAHRGELSNWFQATVDAADAGTSPPPRPDLLDPTSAAFLTVIGLSALVSTVYTVGFWRWKQATPGKLVVGTRIRRRDVPGPLPWSTILLRFGFIEALSLAGQIPYGGALFGLALLLNYLWPLWDDKNQALHDKVAGTNVVLAQPRAMPATAAGLPSRW